MDGLYESPLRARRAYESAKGSQLSQCRGGCAPGGDNGGTVAPSRSTTRSRRSTKCACRELCFSLPTLPSETVASSTGAAVPKKCGITRASSSEKKNEGTGSSSSLATSTSVCLTRSASTGRPRSTSLSRATGTRGRRTRSRPTRAAAAGRCVDRRAARRRSRRFAFARHERW